MRNDIEEDTEENVKQLYKDQDIIEEGMIDHEQPMTSSENYEDTLRNMSIDIPKERNRIDTSCQFVNLNLSIFIYFKTTISIYHQQILNSCKLLFGCT